MPYMTIPAVGAKKFAKCDRCGTESTPVSANVRGALLPAGWSLVQLSGGGPLDDPEPFLYCVDCTLQFEFVP